ncbi:SURF1 family protein [Allosphingosinicella deserti]|uniref:SURF1-like protein n=1 Tax=Allosphingosinicella deserti TaxID=2116704 RepID=A0A2P7QPU4_9SPHN|nr:SURF1 family protein [Sphingomonas deserti]PSJ39968.1 Surfeit locus 1 family protein [Sphingomonas deserti]
MVGFLALGTWQVERRAWKLDLIARVDDRIHAPPVPAPGPAAWRGIAARTTEYLRVRAQGRFRHDRETLVQAVTELGPGFWVLTPLDTDQGFSLLVNRGFVPQDRRSASGRRQGNVDGPVIVTGLLRLTEPGGGFLRSNDPANDRWYSRDVAAIGAARGLGAIAPYFVDADAAPNPSGWPRGGLTQVRFRNSHLSYALTWYGLAMLVAVGLVLLIRHRRSRS